MKRAAVPLVWLVVLSGCGSSTSSPSPGGLSGNWQMTVYTNPLKTPSGFLLQSGNSLSGRFLVSGLCPSVAPAQGQLSGSNVSLTINQTAQTMTLTGTATADESSMSGNYSNLANGCGQTQVGPWTASRVNTLTGNFQSTFTSGNVNAVFHFTGSVTQGANTGGSYALLSGNMTSTDATCFMSASITGQITGTSVVLNLEDSAGDSLGKVDAVLTTDATSASGTYEFSSPTVKLPCVSDYGTVVFVITPSSGT